MDISSPIGAPATYDDVLSTKYALEFWEEKLGALQKNFELTMHAFYTNKALVSFEPDPMITPFLENIDLREKVRHYLTNDQKTAIETCLTNYFKPVDEHFRPFGMQTKPVENTLEWLAHNAADYRSAIECMQQKAGELKKAALDVLNMLSADASSVTLTF